MQDVAVAVEGYGNHALTAEHRAGAETPAEVIHMAHAVEQRQDRRVWSDGGCERVCRGLQIVGLAAPQDQSDRRAQRVGGDGRWRWQARIAKVAADDEAGFGKLRL